MPAEKVDANEYAFIGVINRVGTSLIVWIRPQKMSRRRHSRDKTVISLFENSSNDDMATSPPTIETDM